MTAYKGAAWRSRFLRAPKVAFEIIERVPLVSVEQLAEASLGLKTGCDKFFFVQAAAGPAGDTAAEEGVLPPRRGGVWVSGLNGWSGYISRKDLRPAALNPHTLDAPGGRLFRLPHNGPNFYLYPRDSTPRDDLAEYIRYAENEEVHTGRLVQSNASSRWYRQARGLVDSRWALPYNSAYDFGAWDNHGRVVLNGRFVGVEPLAGVSEDLLGAVLNSTIAVCLRLLVGKATGVEGAFDVGPPAVRELLIPDIRKLNASASAEISEVLEQVRKQDVMPPAPDRNAAVPEVRSNLDAAILRGLGFTSGEAATVASRLYESYARWRCAIEDVEMAMRANRRAMAASGQSRSIKPEVLAARRVWEELQHTVPLYPAGLLRDSVSLKTENLPSQIAMPSQEPLFDGGSYFDASGGSHDLGHYERLRYAAMLSTIGFTPPFKIPLEPDVARSIVEAFNTESERLRKAARKRAAAYVTGANTIDFVVESVEKDWFRRCRRAGMIAEEAPENMNAR